MKTETLKEKIISKMKSLLFTLVQPLYLKSVGAKTLDDYIGEIMMIEIIYSDGTFLKDVLTEYVKQSSWYFDKNKEQKLKIEKFIKDFEDFKAV